MVGAELRQAPLRADLQQPGRVGEAVEDLAAAVGARAGLAVLPVEAQADARDGGTPKLIGTALLREYRPSGRNTWSGTIFVPDMGRTFGSTLKLVDANTISVKGCLIGGFFCKSQIWHRG